MHLADDISLGQVFVKVRDVEPALRRMMKGDLSRSIGPLWRSHLPESLLEEWGSRRKEDMDKGGRDRGPDLLEYATISELTDLILRFWEGKFEHRFGGRDFTQGQLDEFRVLRNMLMHSSPMTSEECERISILADEIVRTCEKPVALPKEQPQQAVGDVTQTGIFAEGKLEHHQEAILRTVDYALNAMSGLFTGERRALLTFLKNHLDQCSFPVLVRVREKFASMPDTEVLVDDFVRELPPRRPRAPNQSWNPTKWLRWATREYIPYRGWLNRKRERDPEVEGFAAMYEKWLMATYPELLREGHDCLVENAYRHVNRLLDAGYSVLWLIIDNLAGFWLAEFEEVLLRADIQIEDYRRMLSMLPSTSSVSRRSMLAGRAPVHAMEFPNDATASSQLWKEQGINSFTFCLNLDEANQAIENGSELIVFLHSRLDKLAHGPEEVGFNREEEMRGLMERLVVKVGQLVRRVNNVRPTKLVVSTDHGSVWPTEHSQVISLPQSASSQDDVETHHRYCVVEEAAGLNEIEWHVLSPELYGLPAMYAVAQGLHFIDMRPRGYSHGGLLPEETAVALLVCSPGEREEYGLGFISHGSALRLGRPGKLSILVRNPFEMPVEDLEIRLPDFHIKFDRVDMEPVSELATNEVEITLPPETEVREDVAYLRLDFEYTIAASRHVDTRYLKINVARLYRSTMENLQDMFND